MHITGSEWTKESDQLVAQGIEAGESHKLIASKLGRTVSAVSTRAKRLGLTKFRDHRPWTEKEDQEIRRDAHYKNYGPIGRSLGRSEDAVRLRAQHLGVHGRTEKTAEEIENQKQSRAAGSLPAPAPHLTKCKYAGCEKTFEAHSYRDSTNGGEWRTKEYCHGHGPSQAGTKYEQPKTNDESNGYNWSVEEDNTVRTFHAKGETHEQLATRVGRTTMAVSLRIQTLGLSTPRVSYKPWTPKDIEYLVKHYATMLTRLIAKRLERDPKAVKQKALALGLKKDEPRKRPDRLRPV